MSLLSIAITLGNKINRIHKQKTLKYLLFTFDCAVWMRTNENLCGRDDAPSSDWIRGRFFFFLFWFKSLFSCVNICVMYIFWVARAFITGCCRWFFSVTEMYSFIWVQCTAQIINIQHIQCVRYTDIRNIMMCVWVCCFFGVENRLDKADL